MTHEVQQRVSTLLMDRANASGLEELANCYSNYFFVLEEADEPFVFTPLGQQPPGQRTLVTHMRAAAASTGVHGSADPDVPQARGDPAAQGPPPGLVRGGEQAGARRRFSPRGNFAR